MTDAATGLEFAVKSIGEYAFQNRDNLTSIDISEGVTTIGYWAFQLCDNLQSVALPESMSEIGGAAFDGCVSLTSIHLPSQITDILWYTFSECTNLSSINIPDGVKSVKDYAFRNCTNLKNITLPEGITEIGVDAFRASGLESIKFPSTLTEVGQAAFRESKVASIDFNGCSAEINAEAFLGTAIEELTIPANIKIKGWTVFGWCEKLRSLTAETNTLGNNDIFKNCTSLETVVLPSTSVLGDNFFEMCTSLKSVTFLNIEENYDIHSKSFYNIFKKVSPAQIQFTVPEGSAETLLRAGYMHLSDLSGLPLVRQEFEDEAARITAMADGLADGDKATLITAISEARTAVNAAEDYATVYAQIAAVKSAANTFLSTATLAKGQDVTAAFITNPDLDRFPIGWNLNTGGQYMESSYENGDISIDRFIEAFV